MEVKQTDDFDKDDMESKQDSYRTKRNFLWFIIPSLLGVFLFLFPIPYGGKITIGVGVLAETVQAYLEPFLPGLMTGILVVSAIVPIFAKAFQPSVIMNRPFMKQLFYIHPFWLVTRILGEIGRAHV